MNRILLTLFLVVLYSFSYSQINEIKGKSWFSIEGIEFKFTDSTLYIDQIFEHYTEFDVNYTDSTILSSRYKDTSEADGRPCEFIIANYQSFRDSLTIMFQFTCKGNNNARVFNYQFWEINNILNSKKFTLYSRDKLVNLPCVTNFNFLKNNRLKLDSVGNIEYHSYGTQIIDDSLYISGYYKGKIPTIQFQKLKCFLRENKLLTRKFMKYHYKDRYTGYQTSTSNITSEFRISNLINNNISNPIEKWFLTDTAWVLNNMKYYGQKLEPNPQSQDVYFPNFNKDSIIPTVIKGSVKFEKSIYSNNHKAYIHSLKIDSVYFQGMSDEKKYSKREKVFFISNTKLNNREYGLVLKLNRIDIDPPMNYKKGQSLDKRLGWFNYFTLQDTFDFEYDHIIFTFYSQSQYQKIYTRSRWSYPPKATSFEFKISKFLRRLEDKN